MKGCSDILNASFGLERVMANCKLVINTKFTCHTHTKLNCSKIQKYNVNITNIVVKVERLSIRCTRENQSKINVAIILSTGYCHIKEQKVLYHEKDHYKCWMLDSNVLMASCVVTL